MTKLVISTSSPEEASHLMETLANPMNSYDVAMAGNNTVEVIINEDTDAALELLAQLVTAQPQYIALGLESPLADALKQTARLLRGRDAQIDAAVNGDYTTAQAYIRPTGCPIILDLDGDGIETTAVTAGAWFDHASDGFAERTGWAGKDDGLLVRDLNGNGLIDAGAELFGSETRLANGQKAANGFQALAELDSNLDGKLDSSDAAFTTLKIWKDIDTDGKTGAGELLTLEQAGVQSINVGYTNSTLVDANGNAHRQAGSYTTAAGQVRAATDVWFQTNPFYSQATGTIPLTPEAQALPDMHGAGMVRNLREAASLPTTEGATLAATVAQFAAGTYDVQKASLDSIVRQWSATSTFVTTVGGAYGVVLKACFALHDKRAANDAMFEVRRVCYAN